MFRSARCLRSCPPRKHILFHCDNIIAAIHHFGVSDAMTVCFLETKENTDISFLLSFLFYAHHIKNAYCISKPIKFSHYQFTTCAFNVADFFVCVFWQCLSTFQYERDESLPTYKMASATPKCVHQFRTNNFGALSRFSIYVFSANSLISPNSGIFQIQKQCLSAKLGSMFATVYRKLGPNIIKIYMESSVALIVRI